MKHCPKCQTEYTDETLQFCLQDGTPLVQDSMANSQSSYDTDAETLVVPKRVEPIRFDLPSSYKTNQTNQNAWETSQPLIVEREAKKSNTAMTVALTFLGTVLLLSLGAVGTWLYLRDNNKKQVAVNISNAVTPNRPLPNANNANNQNQNANLATPAPSQTPTVKPTINPEQAKKINGAVKDVIDNWKDASENLDITGNLSNYADTVDYYNAGKVNISKVRADRERAFSDYDSIEINIDNLRVIPDATGEKATAIFDKEWNFEGAEKTSKGKVQQQLTLDRINGKWLISGEKDLKLYYKK